ncbi:MAG: glutamine--fructose-6-phosphate transaminase (isomerizing) [Alphaproteobacteria bacterium]|nr:glutamine--fructose-6-phosphate transaminase (isomerizing) [Alphaproteobacteria bacterium]
MCGIVGLVSNQPVAARLLEGLKRLEYRGYDSAGIATVDHGVIDRRRAEGKLDSLVQLVAEQPIAGTIGIGHTRWATHGAATERNAHPHASRSCAVVHNGIIENFREIRAELEPLGHVFISDTDTEAVVHLFSHYLGLGITVHQAMVKLMGRLHGAFALAIILTGNEGLLLGARRGSPLAVGYGDGESFLGSDALALAPLTQRISYLEEDDFVELRHDSVKFFRADGSPVTRKIEITETTNAIIGKGNYRHFMEKEIYEQPVVVGDCLSALISPSDLAVNLPPLPFDMKAIERITIVACGTSYYAGMVAKYWLESLANLPVEVDIASEYRYRSAPVNGRTLVIFISQSGETIDTLSALDYVRKAGGRTMAIVNVRTSSMARLAEYRLETLAGPEIGVASTKAFMTQLVVLSCFAVAMAAARGAIDRPREQTLCRELLALPSHLAEILAQLDGRLNAIVERIAAARDVLFLGRGSCYPIAMEGALKLKEISYIHAEGYAAGELKHGPIALISDGVPVIALAPPGHWFEKTASNVEEIVARKGLPIVVTAAGCGLRFASLGGEVLELPVVPEMLAPMVYTLPVQLLAYRVAVRKGTDVDQPRNLAKSVTVE